MHFKFATKLGMCCKDYVVTSSQDGSTTKLAICFNVTCSRSSLIVPLRPARTNLLDTSNLMGNLDLSVPHSKACSSIHTAVNNKTEYQLSS